MVYEILYTKKALKQLKKLEREQKERVINVLERCKIRPHSYVKKLVGSQYFRIRVGELRVIVDIVDKKLVIYLLEINHRRRIYKK